MEPEPTNQSLAQLDPATGKLVGGVTGKGFLPGRSGNPTGKSKRHLDVRTLARSFTIDAIQTLAAIMADPKARGSDRVAAANSLLDRGWGRAPSHVDITAAGHTGPLQVVFIGTGSPVNVPGLDPEAASSDTFTGEEEEETPFLSPDGDM